MGRSISFKGSVEPQLAIGTGRIPQLWVNEKWATEFALIVLRIMENVEKKLIIEIHPPFIDYCPSIKEFLGRYKIFEEILLTKNPDNEILIEKGAGQFFERPESCSNEIGR